MPVYPFTSCSGAAGSVCEPETLPAAALRDVSVNLLIPAAALRKVSVNLFTWKRDEAATWPSWCSGLWSPDTQAKALEKSTVRSQHAVRPHAACKHARAEGLRV